MSWANLSMLLATIPSYDFDTDKKEDEKDAETTDDLRNFLNL